MGRSRGNWKPETRFAGKRITVMGLGLFGGGLGITRYLVRRRARVLEPRRGRAERVGQDHLGARLHVQPVRPHHGLGPLKVPQVRWGPRGQALRHQEGPHGAVQHHHLVAEKTVDRR